MKKRGNMFGKENRVVIKKMKIKMEKNGKEGF
jgi:hypothetical protein